MYKRGAHISFIINIINFIHVVCIAQHWIPFPFFTLFFVCNTHILHNNLILFLFNNNFFFRHYILFWEMSVCVR